MRTSHILYTNLLFFSDGFTPCQSLIVIRKDRKDDIGLLEHERTHVRQMAKDGTLSFWWRYLTSKTHRLRYEAEAYKVSLSHSPNSLVYFATYLSTKYFLGITVEEAMSEILS